MNPRSNIKPKFISLQASDYHSRAVLYGPELKVNIADGVNLMNALINVASGTVWIGEGTFCGHNVCILTGSHFFDGVRKRVPEGNDIHIGRFVWLGSNCTILGPCKIGDRAVIAAGAVVTKDCEADWVYGGVPAKKIKRAEDPRS